MIMTNDSQTALLSVQEVAQLIRNNVDFIDVTENHEFYALHNQRNQALFKRDARKCKLNMRSEYFVRCLM
jgi:signal transduction histidine kinase